MQRFNIYKRFLLWEVHFPSQAKLYIMTMLLVSMDNAVSIPAFAGFGGAACIPSSVRASSGLIM